MFTGIVEATVPVRNWSARGANRRLELDAVVSEPRLGESIALNGVCLTVAELSPSHLAFDLSPETLSKSTFGDAAPKKVHLERALAVGDRLGGHWVTGHVDAVLPLRAVERSTEGTELLLDLPARYRPWVVDKGSITVQGVSLTVNALREDSLSLWLIPHTMEVTHLGDFAAGDRVNVEFDALGKYAVQAARHFAVGEG